MQTYQLRLLCVIVGFALTIKAMDSEPSITLQNTQLIGSCHEKFSFNNEMTSLQELVAQCKLPIANPFKLAALYAYTMTHQRFVAKGTLEQEENQELFEGYSSYLFVAYHRGKDLLKTYYALFLGATEVLDAKQIEQIMARNQERSKNLSLSKSREKISPRKSPLVGSLENIPVPQANQNSLKKSAERHDKQQLLPFPESSFETWYGKKASTSWSWWGIENSQKELSELEPGELPV